MYSNLRNFKLIAILILSSHDLFISSMVAEAMFTFAKLSTGAAKDIALVKNISLYKCIMVNSSASR